ncbi:hypothetical protein N8D56_02465 [Devosia sp. A8/3-2]|nr:hypothetical protein N8D56_02465 [Devosia sp. A8/3-2]
MPLMSTRLGSTASPGTASTRPSSIRTGKRWAKVSSVKTSASASVATMPPRATENPLITEVVKNPMPVTMPTSPLALSRRSSEIRMVTGVGSAMERILPAITPSMTRNTKIQSWGP